MAQSALLEREYTTSQEDEKNTPEAIAHRKRGSEIYREVFGQKDFKPEDVTAAFSMPAPSANAAVLTEAPASAPAAPEAPARRELFSNYEYKDHTLYRTDVTEDTATAIPEAAPAFRPETVPEAENEDLLPTRRTMEMLQRGALYRPDTETEMKQEERVGFFASLSAKTKMVLAIVSALIVVAIALVCINTGIINSIKSGITSKEEELRGLTEYSEELNGRIEEVTDPAYVDDYAEHELGMTRS